VRVVAGRGFKARIWKYLLATHGADESHSWHQPIFSPVDGEVIEAVDGRLDRPINLLVNTLAALSNSIRLLRGNIADPMAMAGNYVIVESPGAYILLAHLRRGSVQCARGSRVHAGQLLGEVGNSGNTLTPHLHIQAMDGSDPLAARIIPFQIRECEVFNGRGVWERQRNWVPVKGAMVRVDAARTMQEVRTTR
jgi:murein DD-endopeptidase MepM/ murein hydrolase activator NlpD